MPAPDPRGRGPRRLGGGLRAADWYRPVGRAPLNSSDYQVFLTKTISSPLSAERFGPHQALRADGPGGRAPGRPGHRRQRRRPDPGRGGSHDQPRAARRPARRPGDRRRQGAPAGGEEQEDRRPGHGAGQAPARQRHPPRRPGGAWPGGARRAVAAGLPLRDGPGGRAATGHRGPAGAWPRQRRAGPRPDRRAPGATGGRYRVAAAALRRRHPARAGHAGRGHLGRRQCRDRGQGGGRGGP